MFQKNMRARTGERLVQEREKWLAQHREELLAQNVEEQLSRAVEQQFLQDIEQRLSAYYGPALPEQPLSEAAWLRLRDKLSVAERARPRRFFMGKQLERQFRQGRQVARQFLRRRQQSAPFELQQVYATLLLQANYRRSAPALRCAFSKRPIQPRVSTGVLGRGRIRLVLPSENWQMLRKAELDMLLAAGLARCSGAARPFVLLPRVLFAVSLLLVLAALPFTSVDRRAVWIFLAAVACCLLSGSVLAWQQRVLAFRSDRLAVQWLGRERVCLGLHQLAEHIQLGRRTTWPILGEPSLSERIARVCGTPLTQKDRDLTLVG
ncbi:MAG TPA: hypothetical protein VF458_03085 [Ktedonobacteraceae bacterium]